MKKNKTENMNNGGFKLPKWIPILLILNLLGVIAISCMLMMNQKKTAFVDLGKLYDGFELTKQKQTELQSMNFSFKNALDSLALEIKSIEDALTINYNKELEEKLQIKKINYYKIEENMSIKLEEEKGKGDELIWQQINTYTQEFGKEKGYDYIYGGNGSGSLMFANESKDISEDVLVYINKKFAGE